MLHRVATFPLPTNVKTSVWAWRAEQLQKGRVVFLYHDHAAAYQRLPTAVLPPKMIENIKAAQAELAAGLGEPYQWGVLPKEEK